MTKDPKQSFIELGQAADQMKIAIENLTKNIKEGPMLKKQKVFNIGDTVVTTDTGATGDVVAVNYENKMCLVRYLEPDGEDIRNYYESLVPFYMLENVTTFMTKLKWFLVFAISLSLLVTIIFGRFAM